MVQRQRELSFAKLSMVMPSFCWCDSIQSEEDEYDNPSPSLIARYVDAAGCFVGSTTGNLGVLSSRLGFSSFLDWSGA